MKKKLLEDLKELEFARKSESFLQIPNKIGYKAAYIQGFCSCLAVDGWRWVAG